MYCWQISYLEFTAYEKCTSPFPRLVPFLCIFFWWTLPINSGFNQKGENFPQVVAVWEMGAWNIQWVHLQLLEAYPGPEMEMVPVSCCAPPWPLPTSFFFLCWHQHSPSRQSDFPCEQRPGLAHLCFSWLLFSCALGLAQDGCQKELGPCSHGC